MTSNYWHNGKFCRISKRRREYTFKPYWEAWHDITENGKIITRNIAYSEISLKDIRKKVKTYFNETT